MSDKISLPEWSATILAKIVQRCGALEVDERDPYANQAEVEQIADEEFRSAKMPSTFAPIDTGAFLDMASQLAEKDIAGLEDEILTYSHGPELLSLGEPNDSIQCCLAAELWKTTEQEQHVFRCARASIAEFEAASAAGGRRAMLVGSALLQAIEGPYQIALRKLVQFRLLQNKDFRRPAEKLGNLVSQAASMFPGLVDAESFRIRNACAHLRSSPPNLKDGTLELFDGEKYRVSLPVDEWCDRACRYFLFGAVTLPRVHALICYRLRHTLQNNFLAQLTEAVQRRDLHWIDMLSEAAAKVSPEQAEATARISALPPLPS